MGTRQAVLGAACATTLSLTSCSSSPPPPSATTTSVVVELGRPTALAVAGLELDLPSDAVAPGTRVSLSTEPAPQSASPSEIETFGSAAVVDLGGAEPSQPATVTFPAPTRLTGGSLIPLVIWQDNAGGWRALPTTWSPGSRTVSATVDHFSSGFLAAINVPAWISRVTADLKNLAVGRAGIAKPHCPNVSGVRSHGISVTSDGGDTVKWCIGVRGGRAVLKIANNRRTFTQLSYPDTWRVVDGRSTSLSLNTIARALGTAASGGHHRHSRVIDSGDTLTLEIPSGESGRAQAAMSTESWAVSGIIFGISVFGSVVKAVDSAVGRAADNVPERVLRVLAGTDDPEATKALRSCTGGIGELSDVPISARLLGPVAKFSFTCGVSIAKALTTHGISLVAAVALNTVATAASTIISGLNLIASGTRELYDTFASFGGRSDPTYDIRVRSAVPATRTIQTTGDVFLLEGSYGRGAACGVDLHQQYMKPGLYCMTGRAAQGCDGEVVYTAFLPPTGYAKIDHGCTGGITFASPSTIVNVRPGDRVSATGGYTCLFGASAVHCTNRDGHGFDLTPTSGRGF